MMKSVHVHALINGYNVLKWARSLQDARMMNVGAKINPQTYISGEL